PEKTWASKKWGKGYCALWTIFSPIFEHTKRAGKKAAVILLFSSQPLSNLFSRNNCLKATSLWSAA
ncbi:MAG: hypothetical protein IKF39_13050, partial [Oscillospiraceae bacterium]|nr:hypothetical protein [Oscillospiraceae bacterium]